MARALAVLAARGGRRPGRRHRPRGPPLAPRRVGPGRWRARTTCRTASSSRERPGASGSTGTQVSNRAGPGSVWWRRGVRTRARWCPATTRGAGLVQRRERLLLRARCPRPRRPADPAWQGHYPDGAIYQMTCPGVGRHRRRLGVAGHATGRVRRRRGHPGAAGRSRRSSCSGLRGPQIGMAPPDGATGLVGVPVWMWTEVAPTTWGPVSATAAVPGLSVTATGAGAADRVGDGRRDVGDVHQPGHPVPGVVRRHRVPDLRPRLHPVLGRPGRRPATRCTATTTWQVTWTGGGQSGVLTVTRTSTTTVSIGELQVLVT